MAPLDDRRFPRCSIASMLPFLQNGDEEITTAEFG